MEGEREMIPLTHKQMTLLKFLCAEVDRCGVAPSFKAMIKATNSRSNSSVHHLLTVLENRHFIKRHRWVHRGIEVIKRPKEASSNSETTKFARAYALGFKRGYEAAMNGEPNDIPSWTDAAIAGGQPSLATSETRGGALPA
jgi:repressor LexA